MRKTFIYGLISNRDNKIRYIGKANNPQERLKHHLYEAKSNRNNTHKSCWLRKEISESFTISTIILEVCNFDEWEEREKFYINTHSELTNTSKGGYGGSPLEYSLTFEELVEWKNNNLPNTITSKIKWQNYIKDNDIKGLPINPNKVFKNKGWFSWSNFLKTNNIHNSKQNLRFLSFNEFIKWLKNNNIKNNAEFRSIKNKPTFIPSHPERFYKKNDWISWNDILPSSRNVKQNYLDYQKAKEYLKHNFNIKNVAEFRSLTKENKIPNFIPKKPERFYKNFSYLDFLK